jgi:undecaprenyl-diphosphatase
MSFTTQIDYSLFRAINNLAGRWLWLDAVARLFLNDYFVPTLMAVILLALWFEGRSSTAQQNNRRAVLVAALAAGLANINLKVINLFYYRPRPFAYHQVNLLSYQPTDSSLPSNAAALGFAIAVGVWFYQRRWGWLLLGVAAVFGLSRIFGGVHYPLDVVSGAALGWFSAWLIHWQQEPVNRLLKLVIGLADKLGLA